MKNNRKGFTIVELVIVIAVIAILAAVLIPTFSSVTQSARESAANSEAKSTMTVVLAATNATLKQGSMFYVDNDKDNVANYKFVYKEAKLEAAATEATAPVYETVEDVVNYVVYVSTKSFSDQTFSGTTKLLASTANFIRSTIGTSDGAITENVTLSSGTLDGTTTYNVTIGSAKVWIFYNTDIPVSTIAVLTKTDVVA